MARKSAEHIARTSPEHIARIEAVVPNPGLAGFAKGLQFMYVGRLGVDRAISNLHFNFLKMPPLVCVTTEIALDCRPCDL